YLENMSAVLHPARVAGRKTVAPTHRQSEPASTARRDSQLSPRARRNGAPHRAGEISWPGELRVSQSREPGLLGADTRPLDATIFLRAAPRAMHAPSPCACSSVNVLRDHIIAPS